MNWIKRVQMMKKPEQLRPVHLFCSVFVLVFCLFFELLPRWRCGSNLWPIPSCTHARLCVCVLCEKFLKSKYFLLFIFIQNEKKNQEHSTNNSRAQSTNAFKEWPMVKSASARKRKKKSKKTFPICQIFSWFSQQWVKCFYSF